MRAVHNDSLEIINEGLKNADDGMLCALQHARELQSMLVVDMKVEKKIRVVKEIAHEFNSYAFWLEQQQFWLKRQSFQESIAKFL